jgi:membrane-bound lytic murein transglycosylase F
VKTFRPSLLIALLIAAGCDRERSATRTPADPRPKSLEAATPKPARTEPILRDFPALQQTRTLRVLFTFNSTGYFVFRGEAMGYEYELLSRFAREKNLRLMPVVVRDSKTLFDRLNRGEGDIVAAQIVAGPEQSEVLVTNELYETSPVVVQRGSGEPSRGMTPAVATAVEKEERRTTPPGDITIRARLVSRPSELAGERVVIPQTSPFRRNLLELNNELDQDIDVVEVDQSTDRLIQLLAEGEIGFTVAADNLAALKTGEYTNLVIRPTLGAPQKVVWALRRNAPLTRDALNQWLVEQRKRGLLAILYRKYFLDRRGFQERAASRYLTAETGRLSPFDDWFRESARIPGWDWRLIASQAYQESRFNPNARSWAGASGLMQIMPATARELRVNPRDPRQSIQGACRYLWTLDERWRKIVERESERIKFILGGYNCGMGHVEDARRLADKNGDNPNDWEHVAYWLIRKSKRSVYNDPVVRNGFVRGTEPVAYVDSILTRFEHYKAFVTADSALPAPARTARAIAAGGAATRR